MSNDSIEAVVIGSGVIGLSCARALARAGKEVLIVEAEKEIGTGISSRNSEVIHAGLHHPANSLKSRLCIAGRRSLYQFLDEKSVPYKRCTKLVVATSESEVHNLRQLAANATAKGVEGLTLLNGEEAKQLEPALACEAAILSQRTGIVDIHALLLALLSDAEAAGASIALKSPVIAGKIRENDILLQFEQGYTISARYVINAAGLNSVAFAHCLSGFPEQHLPRSYLAKGNYFTISGRVPFKRLIYPLPERGGLGIHLTLDLANQARFGPDVEWVESESYSVDIARLSHFEAAIRRYWPDLPDGALRPDYAGIRPKIASRAEPEADFRIDGPKVHGVSGLINLFGIESPGLTACLAIAAEVLRQTNEGS